MKLKERSNFRCIYCVHTSCHLLCPVTAGRPRHTWLRTLISSLASTQHGNSSGSRTLEAPRGKCYAPVRGIPVINQSIINPYVAWLLQLQGWNCYITQFDSLDERSDDEIWIRLAEEP